MRYSTVRMCTYAEYHRQVAQRLHSTGLELLYTYHFGADGHTRTQTASLLRHLIVSLQSLCSRGHTPDVHESIGELINRHVKAHYGDVGALACDDTFHSSFKFNSCSTHTPTNPILNIRTRP